MASHEQAREELLETDEAFRSLYEKHQSRERRLLEISDSPTSSEDEDQVVKGLKVENLRLKDRMEAMIREHL
jgi:uncharacterized protein YdcH (DUF465 family)